jgi:hypothetical protein
VIDGANSPKMGTKFHKKGSRDPAMKTQKRKTKRTKWFGVA